MGHSDLCNRSGNGSLDIGLNHEFGQVERKDTHQCQTAVSTLVCISFHCSCSPETHQWTLSIFSSSDLNISLDLAQNIVDLQVDPG